MLHQRGGLFAQFDVLLGVPLEVELHVHHLLIHHHLETMSFIHLDLEALREKPLMEMDVVLLDDSPVFVVVHHQWPSF